MSTGTTELDPHTPENIKGQESTRSSIRRRSQRRSTSRHKSSARKPSIRRTRKDRASSVSKRRISKSSENGDMLTPRSRRAMHSKKMLDSNKKNDGMQHTQSVLNGNAADISASAQNVKHNHTANQPHAHPSVAKDLGNIAILLLLYTLQGIPMGMAVSVPLLLKERGLGFSAKGTFGMAAWPYGLKLLWAPIVDSVYSSRFGRRKSWVIPVQILTGLMMWWLGAEVDHQFSDDGVPNVTYLTGAFFCLYILVATQDIAVDGWALTMLRPENVGYASTCNSVGQTIGFLTAYGAVVALTSAKTCNKWFRTPETYSDEGLVSLGQFMRFWGVVFCIVTVVLAVFKKELAGDVHVPHISASANEIDMEAGSNTFDQSAHKTGYSKSANDATMEHNSLLKDHHDTNNGNSQCDSWHSDAISKAYKNMLDVLSLPHVLILVSILVTCRFPFSAVDSGTDLELMEKGVPKDMIMMFGGVVITPLEVLTTFIVSRYTAGPRPLTLFLRAFPARLLLAALLACLLYCVPAAAEGEADLPVSFYVILLLILAAYRASANVMFVSQMAFFTRVSDPAIGGTYMTLLNTLSNVGGLWPGPLVLRTMDWAETHICSLSQDTLSGEPESWLDGADCEVAHIARDCRKAGGECFEATDGYTPIVLLCLSIGVMWYIVMRRRMRLLEQTPATNWQVATARKHEAVTYTSGWKTVWKRTKQLFMSV